MQLVQSISLQHWKRIGSPPIVASLLFSTQVRSVPKLGGKPQSSLHACSQLKVAAAVGGSVGEVVGGSVGVSWHNPVPTSQNGRVPGQSVSLKHLLKSSRSSQVMVPSEKLRQGTHPLVTKPSLVCPS